MPCVAANPVPGVQWLPNVAFYQYQLARRLATEERVTFDGISPSNSFHPTWMLLITPLLGLNGEDIMPILTALTLSAFPNTDVALVLYAIVQRMTNSRWPALATAGLYPAKPSTIRGGFNGLETSLSALFAAFYIAAVCSFP